MKTHWFVLVNEIDIEINSCWLKIKFLLDFDECSEFEINDCNPINSVCVNTLGSYKCECLKGFYKANISSYECIDINECHFNLHDCYSISSCYNSYGSYSCKCNNGFYGDGKICRGIEYFVCFF